MEVPSNQTLLRQLKKGERMAFNLIYKRYWKRLYFYAFKIFQDEQACQDVVQDVFIGLWNNAPSMQTDNLEAYLLRATRNRITNEIRNLKWQLCHEEMLKEVAADQSADALLQLQQLEQEIEKTIALLPARCKEIFLLSRKNNLSNKEIAAKLGISLRTVETQIYKALCALREKFPEVAITVLLFEVTPIFSLLSNC